MNPLIRIIYTETKDGEGWVFECDIDNDTDRNTFASINTGDTFETTDGNIRGFIVEADVCDPRDISRVIANNVVEFHQRYPERLYKALDVIKELKKERGRV